MVSSNELSPFPGGAAFQAGPKSCNFKKYYPFCKMAVPVF